MSHLIPHDIPCFHRHDPPPPPPPRLGVTSSWRSVWERTSIRGSNSANGLTNARTVTMVVVAAS